MLRKTVFLCSLLAIVVLLLRVGDLSVGARNYLQNQLAELELAFRQN